MSGAPSTITFEEYMRMVFEYDAEYVDGRIVERPMPTTPHSLMQGFLVEILRTILRSRRNEVFKGFTVMPELRIRTKADRTRIPDLCIMRSIPAEDPPTDPPYLCIEILSPEDRTVETMTKVGEYLDMGAEWVWVIDPLTMTGEIYTPFGNTRVSNGIFRAGDFIEVDVRRYRDED